MGRFTGILGIGVILGLACSFLGPQGNQTEDGSLGIWAAICAWNFRVEIEHWRKSFRISRKRREQAFELLLCWLVIRVRRYRSAERNFAARIFVRIPGSAP